MITALEARNAERLSEVLGGRHLTKAWERVRDTM
ncbi:hypothetical protein Q644_24815 [Brucella intermedia 229E]|uniref:Uncharacterized protein n=1 Tax=Brucella intermedia 229E TaxID=1337887 RepID=U4VDD9_9HYPH|nr:hypothetical protein Q644_24815 [Brucella intermedia 229E]